MAPELCVSNTRDCGDLRTRSPGTVSQEWGCRVRAQRPLLSVLPVDSEIRELSGSSWACVCSNRSVRTPPRTPSDTAVPGPSGTSSDGPSRMATVPTGPCLHGLLLLGGKGRLGPPTCSVLGAGARLRRALSLPVGAGGRGPAARQGAQGPQGPGGVWPEAPLAPGHLGPSVSRLSRDKDSPQQTHRLGNTDTVTGAEVDSDGSSPPPEAAWSWAVSP